MIIDTWDNCYPSNWRGIATPASFSHPAKFSSKLIERIYQHTLDEQWLHEGDSVVDPFGGVALGAWPALRYGLNFTGVELEQHFVDIGNANIASWNTRFAGKLPRWGTAQLIQGDSRFLTQVISQANGVVSSPPFSESIGPGMQQDRARNSSSPKDHGGPGPNYIIPDSPGQLGAMKPGDYTAAISSPPFLQQSGGTSQTRSTGPLADPHLIERHAAGNKALNGYGASTGQLTTLKEGDYRAAAAVSSPPFEDSLSRDVVNADARRQWAREHGISNAEHVSAIDMERIGQRDQEYGSSAGQLGQDSGNTFWAAARIIIEQTYQVLAPGAHAVWVVKGFVKAGKLVDFPGQWREVCEAVGFIALHEHHAMLIKHNGTSLTLEGGEVEHITESKSFFRRLSEKKGSPKIDWETVLCMVKP